MEICYHIVPKSSIPEAAYHPESRTTPAQQERIKLAPSTNPGGFVL